MVMGKSSKCISYVISTDARMITQSAEASKLTFKPNGTTVASNMTDKGVSQ